MKTIVAPTDFSATSINAVEYAADMARVLGADLALLHVCAISLTLGEMPAPAYSTAELLDDAERQIGDLKARLIVKTGGTIRISSEVRTGYVTKEIQEYCSEVVPMVIVLGAESAGAFERAFFGGTTIAAIRQFPWPMVVVPAEAKYTSVRKIGLACDFRKVKKTLPVEAIFGFINGFHAELHVLHVSADTSGGYPPETEDQSWLLHELLMDVQPKYHFIGGTEIEKEIHDFAAKNNLDLLIIIPKKHNFVDSIFGHSHSREFVLQSHMPVMAIHEKSW